MTQEVDFYLMNRIEDILYGKPKKNQDDTATANYSMIIMNGYAFFEWCNCLKKVLYGAVPVSEIETCQIWSLKDQDIHKTYII